MDFHEVQQRRDLLCQTAGGHRNNVRSKLPRQGWLLREEEEYQAHRLLTPRGVPREIAVKTVQDPAAHRAKSAPPAKAEVHTGARREGQGERLLHVSY